jgi:HD-like signal output (HDOD) protein
MQHELYDEAYDELRDKMIKLSNQYRSMLEAMLDANAYHENVNELFRDIHTAKSLSTYVNIQPLMHAFKILEDVLAILRFKEGPLEKEVLHWLLLLNDPIGNWTIHLDMDDLDAIEPIDSYTLSVLKFTVVTEQSGKEILRGLNIIGLFEDIKAQEKIQNLSASECHSLHFFTNVKDVKTYIQENEPHILLIQSHAGKKNSSSQIKSVHKKIDFFPTIVVHEKELTQLETLAYTRAGVEHYVDLGVSSDENNVLLRKLETIAKAYFGKKAIRFLNSPLMHIIAKIKQLPQNITKIHQLSHDKNASIRDLSQLVSQDIALTARLLKLINSPSIGIRGQISSVHQAVALLGKERTTALCLQLGVEDTFDIDLSCYDISTQQFFEIAQRRMSFMFHWFRFVSISDVGMVCTAALLGSIGQIIINDEVLNREDKERFQDLLFTTSSFFAEVETLHTSAMDITADILTHWGLEDTLSHIVRYSIDPTSAEDSIKKLAIGLHVAFALINPIDEPIQPQDVYEMRELLRELNFNLHHFDQALQKIGYEGE